MPDSTLLDLLTRAAGSSLGVRFLDRDERGTVHPYAELLHPIEPPRFEAGARQHLEAIDHSGLERDRHIANRPYQSHVRSVDWPAVRVFDANLPQLRLGDGDPSRRAGVPQLEAPDRRR